jgi:hypothetical protein
MAFVYRSDRVTQLGINQGSEVGPGEYIDPKPFLTEKASKVPFGVQSKRDSKPLEPTPGPGSYFVEHRYNNSNEDEGTSEPLYKIIDTVGKEIQQAGGNKPFTFTDKRFKDNLNDGLPGPGHYHRDELKSFRKEKSKLAKIAHNVQDTKNKVSSIPFKENAYGYDFDVKGNLILNKSPDLNNQFKGEKEDRVGPDRYNVVKSSDWIKNQVDWSKSKAKREEEKPKEPEMLPKPEFDVIPQRKKYMREKIVKDLVDRRKRIFEMQETVPKPSLVEEIISKETPGPGYYYDEVYSSFKPKQRPAVFQSFGSFERRFFDKNLYDESNDNMEYRRPPVDERFEKMKINKLKEQMNFNSVFVKEMKRKRQTSASVEKVKVNVNDWTENLGPGTYEVPEVKRVNPSNISSFGSMEKRFRKPPEINEKLPGPGSYYTTSTLEKVNNKSNTLGRLLSRSVIRTQRERSNFEPEKEPEQLPSVGQYSPEINSSISYKVLKNVYKYNNASVPFQSKESRFKVSAGSGSNIGPGLYYKEVPKGLPEKIVKQSPKRPKFDDFAPDLGPGSYNVGNYFDWNKKSYNILYV